MELFYSILAGTTTTTIGALIGYRLGIKSMKRQEFNLLAEPILIYLEEDLLIRLEMKYNSNIGENRLNQMEETLKIKRRLGFIAKPKFEKLLNDFNNVIQYVIKNPAPYANDKNKYIDKYDDAICETKKLIKFLKLK